MEKKRILTGERPTGKMHLGHYIGTLKNRVKLQNEYESIYIVADLHMLTTKNKPEHIKASEQNTLDMILDQIAIGIDPGNVRFYLQSAIPEIHEVYTLLQNLVTVARLERIPSLKDMARDANIEMPFGLLGYPVLQTADIIAVKSHLVPVGKDNVAHVEVAREIARRFNQMYGELFPIPDFLQGENASLIGIYGKQKMSKSADNAIFLSDEPGVVRKKVMKMYTDENRIRADIPGKVEGNPVFIYHELFNPNKKEVDDLKARYLEGKVGDVEVKEKLAFAINTMLEPFLERRQKYSRSGIIEEILVEGTDFVRKEVQQTVYEMKKMMGFTGIWNRIRRRVEKHRKQLKKE
ncbi:MAG: tryptophan--tRNA ligase [Spirochaetales bacterium]|nr:tryptophan--tRNA ligase [Spirochaetales bacterium]